MEHRKVKPIFASFPNYLKSLGMVETKASPLLMRRRVCKAVLTRACVAALLCLLVLHGLSCQQPPEPELNANEFKGRVVGVADGDTISVLRDGKAVRIRLWGIDTPEKKQAYGTRAKQFTSDACFQKVVLIRIRDIDRYQRLVAEVVLPDGRQLNRELIRAGLAWWYEHYARNEEEFKSLQAQAQAQKLGLWKDKNPVAPWDFRRLPKKTDAAPNKVEPPPPSPLDGTTTVYVTKTGTRYHRKDCKTLKGGSTAVSLKEAKSRGLSPCQRCKP
ncbi:MAG: thermonuclease family protein [Candidatus Hydrogenedentales bacterium]|jgi:micrococcal nuclease